MSSYHFMLSNLEKGKSASCGVRVSVQVIMVMRAGPNRCFVHSQFSMKYPKLLTYLDSISRCVALGVLRATRLFRSWGVHCLKTSAVCATWSGFHIFGLTRQIFMLVMSLFPKICPSLMW